MKIGVSIDISTAMTSPCLKMHTICVQKRAKRGKETGVLGVPPATIAEKKKQERSDDVKGERRMMLIEERAGSCTQD